MIVILKRSVRVLPYLFVFIASLYLPTDPDLGWHLRYGEYFFTHHQILKDNIFSTMMANYYWVNGTWGTDILTYTIYKIGDFLSLTLASAGIVTTTFFFFARAGSLDFLSESFLFPLFAYFLIPANNSSFRGQQISYLFLGILVYIISKYKPKTKLFLCIPILFLIWCNIHEEAFLFLTFFAGWTGFTVIKNVLSKKNHWLSQENLFLVSIFLASTLITFINPFGADLQKNALSYFGNSLVTHISEYAPYPIFSLNWWNQIIIGLLLLIFIVSLFFKKTWGKHFPIVIISMILLLLGFSMRRYLWPAYYSALSFISVPLVFKKKSIKKYSTIIGSLISLISLFLIIQYKLPFTQFTTMSWDTYCQLQTVPCSPISARYLQTHKLPGRLFSYYDWGGWLIWNYPDIKPSIDGRMTEWKDANGYSATTDYDAYENAQKSIENSPYDVVYLPNDNSPLSLELSTLVQQKKWKVVYEDELSGIAVRINN